ncbi:MAG: DNA primase [Myxococcales bacterium]|nr:DNA primase [Myxococcales bacterium]
MAKIPRETVDAVRERTDIAEVIERHVALKRRGRNLVGLCPFHQEKTPSFNVIPDKAIFHCFGCQTGGDVFKFLMLLEGLSFGEAVRELASAAGVEIQERELTPAELRAHRKRATLFDVLEAASQFFEAQLWTRPEGAAAREYLQRRQMTEETSRKGRLGWAPGGWTNLIDHMHGQGYRPEQLADAGLARPRQSGSGFYDTLRERLVIPIRDQRGRTIAFGGRLLEGDGPKYLNTPETRLYQKSKVLFGLDQARGPIQQRGRVLIVEGYFDVLSLHQAGFGEAVATCGTALTPDHLERIRRLAKDVILLMDADEAGLRAAERALPAFVDAGIQPWRLTLPGAKDPDDLVREGGPEALEAALGTREPLFEWVVGRKLDGYGASAMSRERVLDEVLVLLRKLRDPSLASRVARRLGIQEATVLERLRSTPAPAATADEEAEPVVPTWRPHRDVVHLLWLLVHRYDRVADLVSRVGTHLLDGHAPVRNAVVRLVAGEPVAALEDPDPEVQRTLLAVAARDSLYEEAGSEVAVVEILARLAKPLRSAQLATVTQQVQDLERQGDADALREAIQRKLALISEERQLESALKRADIEAAMAVLASPDDDTS